LTGVSDNRLRWLARRGMLELDTWLNRFLDKGYDKLPIALQRRFVYLLEQDDMTLYDWLSGSVEPPPDMKELVDGIRGISTDRH
jgi:antitoxin CptB